MSYQPQAILDGQPVEKITAFLFPKGGHENPKVLLANAEKSFVGSYVLGMGFTFDDTAPEATSLAEMQRLIAENPKNQERIFPYIGGSEVNSSPTHAHHRYVINFGEMSEEEAREWPELMAIVEEKVKPERLKVKDRGAKEKWWQFIRTRLELQRAIAALTSSPAAIAPSTDTQEGQKAIAALTSSPEAIAPSTNTQEGQTAIATLTSSPEAIAPSTDTQEDQTAIAALTSSPDAIAALTSSPDAIAALPSSPEAIAPPTNENATVRDRVLVISLHSQYFIFAFLPANSVFSHALAVFTFNNYSAFCTLQSRTHEIWARFFGSSLEDRLRYTPSDCFETFPFPENWENDRTLETIGQTYYQFRAVLIVCNNQGLTDTYNRFHAPQETDPGLIKLRELHRQMDRAILDAYGWQDIDTTCGFALDYLDINEDNLPLQAQARIASGDLYFPTAEAATDFDNLVQSATKKRKKLPWRYRWPETTHDEVLARLLDLNQKRYEEEVIAGLHGKKKNPTKRTSLRKTIPKSKTKDHSTPTIPGMEI